MIGLSIAPAHERVVDAGREAGRAPLDRLLHVLAGAEGPPRAGEDRDLQVGAVAELGPGLGQPGAQLGAERVQPLRPVHADQHHAAVALQLNDRHALPLIHAAATAARRWSPRQESNLRTWFRKPLLCPLSYGGTPTVYGRSVEAEVRSPLPLIPERPPGPHPLTPSPLQSNGEGGLRSPLPGERVRVRGASARADSRPPGDRPEPHPLAPSPLQSNGEGGPEGSQRSRSRSPSPSRRMERGTGLS